MAKVHFLSDIFELLNMLNLQLKGRPKTKIGLFEKLKAFRVKLILVSDNLNSKSFCIFLA